MEAQTGRLRFDGALGLVEAGLEPRSGEHRTGAARPEREACGGPGVGRLDPVLAVGPVADQLQPAAVDGQSDVRRLRAEHPPGLILGSHRIHGLYLDAEALPD